MNLNAQNEYKHIYFSFFFFVFSSLYQIHYYFNTLGDVGEREREGVLFRYGEYTLQIWMKCVGEN